MAEGRILKLDRPSEPAVVRLVKPVVREVPKEWTAELAEFSPRNNRFSWLHLLWEEGYPWEPVERYMIYQMVPRHGIPQGFLEQLEHPAPPSQMGNYYDQHMEWVDDDGVSRRGKFIRNPDCIITERAYWLYRETKCWGRPFWVIQGNEGGHKRYFSPVERKFLKLAGLDPEPPAPGDLPYADFDGRVMKRLSEHDLLKAKHSSLRRQKTLLQGAYSARYEEEEKDFRIALVKWLAEQITEIDGEKIMKSLMKLDAPRLDYDVKEMEERSERATENFIQTGRTYGGMKIN